VDEVEDNRRIYSMFLTAAGFEVQSASDGPEALAKVRTLRPDVVVMDFSIPGLMGGTSRAGSNATRRRAGSP
jgi:CheY-like chemotaxis protein